MSSGSRRKTMRRAVRRMSCHIVISWLLPRRGIVMGTVIRV